MHKEIQMCKNLHTKAVNIVERNCSSKKRDVGTIIYIVHCSKPKIFYTKK